ncbi:hypothetical protein QJQ45_006491 [Haematococcus lacustris]|nr:hypothetical protein QJQ45_006491 [Haematococcus lacustris]
MNDMLVFLFSMQDPMRVLDPVNFRSMGGNAKPLPPVNQLDDEHSEHVVPEVARLAGAPYQTTLQELDSFLNSAWSSAMVRHANSILRTPEPSTVPGEPTVTYLADMDSRRAFWSVTAAEQVCLPSLPLQTASSPPPPLTVPAIVDLQSHLAKAAVRLLSVHVSTAAAERNWSVWTSIYRNALRNSLSVEQAEKLVYVKAKRQVRDGHAHPSQGHPYQHLRVGLVGHCGKVAVATPSNG